MTHSERDRLIRHDGDTWRQLAKLADRVADRRDELKNEIDRIPVPPNVVPANGFERYFDALERYRIALAELAAAWSVITTP